MLGFMTMQNVKREFVLFVIKESVFKNIYYLCIINRIRYCLISRIYNTLILPHKNEII